MFSLVPFVTFGEEISEPATNTVSTLPTPETPSDFCSGLVEINKKINDQISKAIERQTAYQVSRDMIIENKETESDSKLAISRTLIESERINNWDKMVNNAKTDEQKDAVISYQVKVQNAVDTRRTAEDNAITAYREGLAKVISVHTDAVSETVSSFKIIMNEALLNAENNCSIKTSKEAEANFLQKIGEAKNLLITAAQKDTTKEDIAKMKSTRDNDIKIAEEIFKSSIDKAQDDLVIALDK